MKRKVIVFYCGMLISTAHAATYNVDSTTPQDSYNISTGDSLIIDGGKTFDVFSHGGEVRVLNGSLIQGNLSVKDAPFNMSESIVIQNGNQQGYLHVEGPNVVGTVVDSNIQGNMRGINVNKGATLNVVDSMISANKLDNIFDSSLNGAGATLVNGTINIKDSIVFGDKHGAVSFNLPGENEGNDFTLDNSFLKSGAGSAVFIERLNNAPSPLNKISINNGSVIESGNKILIEAINGTNSFVSVDNSSLMGDIIADAGKGTNLDLMLVNKSRLKGGMSNVRNVSIDNDSGWKITRDSDVLNLVNSGDISFSDDLIGKTLHVKGDYEGQGGRITFNSVLKGDSSVADNMAIDGDVKGQSFVSVNNMGGEGEKTVKGVRLISVNGSIDGGTEFVSDRIVAGGYDYKLVRGGDGGDQKSWYLTNTVSDDVKPDPDPGPDPDPIPSPKPGKMFRQEMGSYLSNISASREMFITSFSERPKFTVYFDPKSKEMKTSALWSTINYNNIRNENENGGIKNKEDRSVLRIGGDVYNSNNWRWGVMAGYGSSRSNSRSSVTDYKSKGEVDGYSVGVYATWVNNNDRDGAYLDSWLQYAWFNNKVSGYAISEEKYKTKGAIASIEGGYVLNVYEGNNSSYFIQPQMQVVWSGVDMKNHYEENGTRVVSSGDGFSGRVGVKFFSEHSLSGTTIRPSVEVNWLHSNKTKIKMDDFVDYIDGKENVAQVKFGLEGEVTKRLKLWGNAKFNASGSYRDTGVMIGGAFVF